MAVCLLAALCISCGKPAERFDFIYTPESFCDTSVFRFEMMMDEPESIYSTRIACRYNASKIPGDRIPVLVAVISPEGKKYCESVDLPLSPSFEKVRIRKCGGSVVDIDWPYRDRIVPGADTGMWQVAIRPIDRSMLPGIYGMGFAYKIKR